MAKQKTKILVVGGGFGGIKTALELANNPMFNVTLISDQSNFRYYPTLYHTATGGKQTASSIPLTEIFNGKPVKIIKDKIADLDRQSKTITGASKKKYRYDTLVLALGVITNYFGIKGLKEFSFGIKSLEDAQELRDHIHKLLMDERKPDINYIVIGGGPTGVELAGALPGYIKHVMKQHQLPPKKLHIELVEAAPRLVPRMPKSYSRAIAGRLRRLGIKLYLNQAVQVETADSLQFGGRSLKSHTVIWTAGVTNNPFYTANGFKFGQHGKVLVNEHLQAEPDIYVIGDNADTPYSGLAQTALYDAVYLANNLARQGQNKTLRAYRPKRPIYVTPAGPRWAAVLWNRVHLYGWLGWLLRSAADFAGYRDYEPWWTAGKHWLAEYQAEDSCPICAHE